MTTVVFADSIQPKIGRELEFGRAIFPGFGGIDLLCDGSPSEAFWDYCGIVVDRGVFEENLGHRLTLDQIEDACADDPDHIWTLVIYSALVTEYYERTPEGRWLLVKTGSGIAGDDI